MDESPAHRRAFGVRYLAQWYLSRALNASWQLLRLLEHLLCLNTVLIKTNKTKLSVVNLSKLIPCHHFLPLKS